MYWEYLICRFPQNRNLSFTIREPKLSIRILEARFTVYSVNRYLQRINLLWFHIVPSTYCTVWTFCARWTFWQEPYCLAFCWQEINIHLSDTRRRMLETESCIEHLGAGSTALTLQANQGDSEESFTNKTSSPTRSHTRRSLWIGKTNFTNKRITSCHTCSKEAKI